MKKVIHILILFICIINILFCQKQGNFWFFSQNAGINFNTSPPTSISSSAINTSDNSSSISDNNGKLLFYSDGLKVYNKNNLIMPNGTNLSGSKSGGQATLIVPIPQNNKFVVFSVPDLGNKPLYYSIVNMNLNNQNGDVELKNQKLFENSTEKIAGIYNCTEDYYWVIAHKYETDSFFVYKIDKNGIYLNPIISKVGKVHTGGPNNAVNNSAGQLSLSKDGSRFASALYNSGEIELFDFDIFSGKVSNPKLIPNYSRAWGVEFSQDGSKLYLSQWTQTNITQFDLTNNNINSITRSAQTIGYCSGSGGYYSGYLQRGPDDKIYIAQWNSKYLSVINNPNLTGSLCAFSANSFNLSSGVSKAGLCRCVFPDNFIMGYPDCCKKVINLIDTLSCDKIVLNGKTITTSGNYSDTIRINSCDSINNYVINILNKPIYSLGPDTVICENEIFNLKSSSNQTKWSNGSIGKELIVDKPGIYWGELTNACGTTRDSVIVAFKNCLPCTIECKNIGWAKWNMITNSTYIGTTMNGSATLVGDFHIGLIYPFLTDIDIFDPPYFPKKVIGVPTLWMPGNLAFQTLTHRVILDKITDKKELLFLVGDFPNQQAFSTPQIGKMRVYDRSNNLLDISNLCLLLEDYGPDDDPIKITNFGTEIQFDVNGPRTAFHGGNLIYTNFPDSSYFIEVEHHNSRSSPDDGVYINIGYPDCCKTVTKLIDTISCEKIVLNGKTITTSGSYSDTIRINNCDSINNYVITILNKPIFSLGNDTVICEGKNFILKSPSDLTNWSNGSIGKEFVVDKPGIYWGELTNSCGTSRDSVIVAFKNCLPCTLDCKNIGWALWNMSTNSTYIGSTLKGSATLVGDIHIGLIHPFLTDIDIFNPLYFPKKVIGVPTLWMPGNLAFQTLTHHVILDKITDKKELLFLVGDFPNQRAFSTPQIGKMRVYDRSNNLLDISNLCLLLEDYGPNDDPIKITNLGTEIQFDVNGPRTTFHGGNLIYTNFPDSSYFIEIEHYNSRSSPDDGVYINIGYPDCCKKVINLIDTVSCEKIVLNGKTITTSGSYSDTIRVNNCDSINNYVITILNKPIFSLGNDTVICEGETFILKSPSDLTNWSNGSIGKEVVVDKPGIYWGEISTICGVIRDSVTIMYRALPMLELGPDRQICPSDVDTIWTNDPNTIWHDGSTGSFFIINKEGVIKATILDFCGNLSDSLVVSFYNNSLLMLPEDTLICEGDSIVLSSTSDSTIWNTGTKGKNIVVKKSGLYWGEIKNICGISRDSINILYTSKPILELGPDLQICPNHVDTIWSNNPNTIWHDGSIGSFFIIKQEGLIKAKLSNFCGEINDSAFVSYYPSIRVKLPQDTLLCEGDLFTLTSTSPTTQWSTGDIGNSIIVSTSGLYWAEINNTCGLSRDSIHIYFQNKPNLELGKDFQICPSESDTIWSNDPNTLWHDGSVGPYFIAKKEGTIIAYLSNFCGVVSDSIKVSYYPNSNVDLGPDTTICEGTILTLNSGSSSSVWFDNTSGSSHQITKAGIYWVSIVSPCGLISDTIQIKEMKVYEKPYLPNDTFICEGININLSIPIIDELWNKQFHNNIDINKPGTYWYEFKDNCNNLLDTIKVFYDSIPNEFPSEHLIFCGQDEFNFSTGDPRTEWSNGTIGSGININKSGIYSFIISNSCGIFIDSISLEFIEDNGLYLPNVFSPNGDQVNDVFPGIQFTEDFDIEIYDRWGSRLFESSNKHWNGTFKSQDVPPGVYAYIIRSKACKHKIKYGNITLVR